MPVFFLNPANADFAEGKGLYIIDSPRALNFISTVMRISLMLGAALTVAASIAYFYSAGAHQRLLSSVRPVTANVTGCEGPGRFQNVQFHYTIDGKPYDQSAYLRPSQFVGGSGLIDACASGSGTVQLRYLAADPSRWSIAPLSPLKREELEQGTSSMYLMFGPTLLLIAGIYALVWRSLKKRKEKQERLRSAGMILKAELIKAKEDASEDSRYNIRCEYRFTSPRGTVLTGNTSGLRRDIKKTDYPPPGTPMLVVYVDDELFEAL
jgi:hypothetical protein